MNALVSHALPTLLGTVLKGTLLLCAAWAACRLLRPASAATRHLAWSAALIGVLLLPLLSVSLPKWNVAWGCAAARPVSPPASAPASVTSDLPPHSVPANAASAPPLTPASEGASGPPVTDISGGAASSSAPTTFTPAPITWALMGVTLWLVGALAVLTNLAVGLGRIGQMRRQAAPLEAGQSRVAEAARQQLGLRRRVEFLRAGEGSAVAVPVTWGVLHPTVLLPGQSSGWSEECSRAALLHELAHVQRWDWGTQLMTRLVCALYWWHPLVWWAARQAREESERACDDLVLGTGMRAADYAQRLLEVVRSLPAGTSVRTAAIAMAQPSEVEGRLQSVLARGRNRSHLSRRGLAFTLTALIVLLLPLAVLRPIARAVGSSVRLTAETVPATRGYQMTLPNGYTVGVAGLTRATPLGDGAGTFGGPFWGPDGTPLTSPLLKSKNEDGPWSEQHNVFALDLTLTHTETATAATDVSTYYEVKSAEGRPAFLTGVPLMRNNDWSKGVVLPVYFPNSVRSCSLRYGVAAGPWRTVATLAAHLSPAAGGMYVELGDKPTVMYQTQYPPSRIERTDYFLGAAGRLGNVARRAVIVDDSGRQTPLQTGIDGRGLPEAGLIYRQGSLIGGYPEKTLTHIKQVLLQTRPYQTVEFRNVQLQPLSALRPVADAQATAPAPASGGQIVTSRQGHNILKIVYLKDVASNTHPARPWTLTNIPDGQHRVIRFTDVRTGTSFRDGKEIQAAFNELLAQGWKPRPGAEPYLVPPPLSVGVPTRQVFFTPDQRQFTANLETEKAAWTRLIQASPVIAMGADIEPQTMAYWSSSKPPALVLDIHYTPDGAKKMAAFTTAHHGEIMGIILDDGLLVAPMIEGTTSDISEISGGLGAIADAQLDAQRINDSAAPRPQGRFVNPTIAPSPTAEETALIAWLGREQRSMSNMKRINLLIQEYIQDHDGRMPALRTLRLLERDLAPYLKQQEKFPNPTTGQSYRVRGGALFVSPLTGQPYRTDAALSERPIAKIARPTYTVLFSDGPTPIPPGGPALGGTLLLEAFADGHVEGKTLP